MTKLRTNCESAELKAKAYCDTEMLKIHHSISMDLNELFKDVSRGFSLKEDVIRFETEYDHRKQNLGQNFFSRTPQHMDFSTSTQAKVPVRQQTEVVPRWVNNIERLSGSDSKVPNRKSWGKSATEAHEGGDSRIYDGLLQSRPISGNSKFRDPLAQLSDKFIAAEQRNPYDRRTQESTSFTKEKRPTTPTMASIAARQGHNQASTPQPLLRASDNPFLEIERKLAVFDIKNPSNNKLIRSNLGQPSHSAISSSNLRNSPLLGLKPWQGLHDDSRPVLGKLDLPAGSKLESVDNLRCFRQKVRDRLQVSHHSRAFIPLF